MCVPSIYRFSARFSNPIEGDPDGFELSVGAFFETFEIMTKMLLFQQGASKNIPARAVFMWL